MKIDAIVDTPHPALLKKQEKQRLKKEKIKRDNGKIKKGKRYES